MNDLQNMRILITPTSFGISDPELIPFVRERVGKVILNDKGRPLTETELIDLMGDVDGVIGGLDPFTRPVINAANRLKVIARYGVGLDNVDLTAAKEGNITVTFTPGANAASVADLTLALILLLCRPVCQVSDQVRRGEWPRTSGLGLDGKTLGLIGMGAIGKQVANRLNGFGCKILAFDVVPIGEWPSKPPLEVVDLDTLLANSDFVSLHLPASPKTENMVDAVFINKMKDGARLINTSRGELINEIDLLDALNRKKISGAALDAFREEPPGSDNSLVNCPQVIATPHMGAHTDSSVNTMGWTSAKDCLAVLRGELPRFPVT